VVNRALSVSEEIEGYEEQRADPQLSRADCRRLAGFITSRKAMLTRRCARALAALRGTGSAAVARRMGRGGSQTAVLARIAASLEDIALSLRVQVRCYTVYLPSFFELM
jgi:hypothetical protein